MGYQRIPYSSLKELCTQVFTRFGYASADAGAVTEVLLSSDLYGIESHGIQRLILYARGIRSGRIVVEAKPTILRETPVSLQVDGCKAMGQLVGRFCMERVIEKAKVSGMAAAAVRNSNHYGIAGYYARMAVREGLIGISMTNTQAIVVPTNGRRPMLGTNPVAVAMPAKPVPFVLDMSSSTVTRGKVEVYSKNGKALPNGWAVGEDGRTLLDAARLIELSNTGGLGGLLPLGGESEETGGHKGYGIALAVELFTSLLSGGLTCDRVRMEDNTDGVSHFFMAIDPGLFGDASALEAERSAFLQKLRDAPKADGCNRIYTHGEKEEEAYLERMKNGIPMNDGTLSEIRSICESLGLEAKDYLK